MTGRIEYKAVYTGVFAMLTISAVGALGTSGHGAATLLYAVFLSLLYAATLFGGWQYGRSQSAFFKGAENFIAIATLFILPGIYFFSTLDRVFVWFLIGLQAAKNVTFATRRDLYFGYVVSLMLIMYAASATRESGTLFYIVLYVLAGIYTLMSEHIDEKMEMAMGGDKETLLKGSGVTVKGVGVAASTLLVAVLFYLFFPRPTALNLQALPVGGNNFYNDEKWEEEAKKDQPPLATSQNGGTDEKGDSKQNESKQFYVGVQRQATDYRGFGLDFDITERGSCDQSNEIVLYLQSDRGLYLRGNIFLNFDGRTWRRDSAGSKKLHSPKGVFKFATSHSGERVPQTITVRKYLYPYLFGAYRAEEVHLPGTVMETNSEQFLGLSTILGEGTIYSVVSRIDYRDGHPTGGTELADFTADRYRQLYWAMSPGIPELAREVTRDFRTTFDKAKAIEEYLKNNYTYTRDTVFDAPPVKVAEEFLFETKKGHCEYFATSMVLMLRSLEIPARFVTGYVADDYNPVTGYYEVRATDAHAWVEAYIEGRWTSFEPTPGFVLPAGRERRMFAAMTFHQYITDRAQDFFERREKGFFAGILEALYSIYEKIVDSLRYLLQAFLNLMGFLWHVFKSGGWFVLAVIALLALGAYAAYRLLYRRIVRWRLERLRERQPERFMVVCYLEATKSIGRWGITRREVETPHEFLKSAEQKRLPVCDQLRVLTELLSKSVFGPAPLEAEERKRAYDAFLHIFDYKIKS